MKTRNWSLPAMAGSAPAALRRRTANSPTISGAPACRYIKSQSAIAARKLGPTLQLPLPDGGTYSSPSVSRDGKWMAYDSSIPGKPNSILLRDLSTGTDHFLDDKGSSLRADPMKIRFLRTVQK